MSLEDRQGLLDRISIHANLLGISDNADCKTHGTFSILNEAGAALRILSDLLKGNPQSWVMTVLANYKDAIGSADPGSAKLLALALAAIKNDYAELLARLAAARDERPTLF